MMCVTMFPFSVFAEGDSIVEKAQDIAESVTPEAEAAPAQEKQESAPAAENTAELTESAESVEEDNEEVPAEEEQNVISGEAGGEAETLPELAKELVESVPPEETDEAVLEVQSLISGLPSLEDVQRMTAKEKTKTAQKIITIQNKYGRLSAEQQAKVAGYENVEALAAELADILKLVRPVKAAPEPLKVGAALNTDADGSNPRTASSFSDELVFCVAKAPSGSAHGELRLSGVFCTAADIPGTVTYNGYDYDVTAIDSGAFGTNTMTSVHIPSTVSSIADGVAMGSIGTLVFDVPLSASSGVDSGAFGSLRNGISTIKLPSSWWDDTDTAAKANDASAGYSFFGCEDVGKVEIAPKPLAKGDAFFTKNNGTDASKTNSDSMVLEFVITKVSDGSNPGEVAVGSANNDISGDLTVPSTVTGTDGKTYTVTSLAKLDHGTYHMAAFAECASVTGLTLPDTITKLDNGYDFAAMFSLTSITLPANLESIGANEFYGDVQLGPVTIPPTVTSIGSNAFYGCIRIKSVTFTSETMPENIDPAAFSGAGLGNVDVYIPASWLTNGLTLEKLNEAGGVYQYGGALTYIAAFEVIIDDGIKNGKVEADTALCVPGDKVTLTATPDTGYVFGAWNVTGTNGTVTVGADNTFTMPSSDVTVSATFRKIQTVTAENQTVRYGEQNKKLTASTDGDGKLCFVSANTDVLDFNADGSIIAKKPGTASVKITAAEGKNYAADNVGKTITVTVDKALLTITADKMTAKKNGEMPELTFTVTGLVGSDKLPDGYKPSSEVSDTKNVGEYKISFPRITDTDFLALYDITYKGSTLTITAEYKVIEGAGQDYKKGSGKTATFRANGEFADFEKVQVDGKDVPTTEYKAWEGSTYVRLSNKFLESLSVGKHDITYLFKDGKCSCSFSVVKASGGIGGTPKTGDTFQPIIWVNAMLVCAYVTRVIIVNRKKKAYEGK